MEEDAGLFESLASFLNSIGLGSLFTVTDGKPSGWLWEQIKSGIDSREALLFALEQTPEFQSRFKVIFDMREKAVQTGGGYVPSVSAVLEYEQQYASLMSAAGVPSWFYDSYEDAHRAMSTGLSPTQIEQRVQRGYGIVQQMPQQVRDVFQEYYGTDAEGALLAAVLDPQKTLNEIDRATRTATIGGLGRTFGFDISRQEAGAFADVTQSPEQIRASLLQAAQLRPLTQETMGERGVDITEGAALGAAFGTSAEDQQILQQRLATRRAQQSTVGGGAATGQSGITGAGVV